MGVRHQYSKTLHQVAHVGDAKVLLVFPIKTMPNSKPDDEKMIRINIWLPPDLDNFLKQVVDAHNVKEPWNKITVSSYLRSVIASLKYDQEKV